MQGEGAGRTRCLSFGQVPTGHTNFSAFTPWKPASFIHPSRYKPGHGSMLVSRDALMNSVLNLLLACSSVNEPSGEVQVRSRSMNSTQPPGFVFLKLFGQALKNSERRPTHSKHCRFNFGQSLMPLPIMRQWMKSKGWWYAQSCSTSSTSKRTFGGTLIQPSTAEARTGHRIRALLRRTILVEWGSSHFQESIPISEYGKEG